MTFHHSQPNQTLILTHHTKITISQTSNILLEWFLTHTHKMKRTYRRSETKRNWETRRIAMDFWYLWSELFSRRRHVRVVLVVGLGGEWMWHHRLAFSLLSLSLSNAANDKIRQLNRSSVDTILYLCFFVDTVCVVSWVFLLLLYSY